jgi:uncharacterized protein YdeI (YjbR/CyaY-like superfamily)
VTPRHFRSATAFRTWLERHHNRRTELWVGFHKKASGRRGLSYKEALDQALCYGWIDGVRRSVDESSYVQRFTPRTATSNWSQINIRRVAQLTELGQMAEPGRRVFEARVARKAPYSYEHPPAEFPSAFLRAFRANRGAWAFFGAQPPGYQRLVRFWVLSAKKDVTRARRFATLLDDCAAGRRIKGALP